ncbi:MAG: hypothetical protein Q9227_003999 [Pyrenula ochraceoflavens]
MTPKICVVGSLNVDFTTVTPRVPKAGETLRATSLRISPGGKGANQAVACGRASYTSPNEKDVIVEMVGAVGKEDPHYATLLKPALEKSGVNCAKVVETERAPTGTATIIVDSENDGENRILFVPGANHEGMRLGQTEIGKQMGDSLPGVVVFQGEIPRDTVVAFLEYIGSFNRAPESKETGKMCRVILNPAPVFERGIPKHLYSAIDTLIVNETEMELLMPQQGNVKQAQETFHEWGVKTVIVTLGAQGAAWSSRTTDGAVAHSIRSGQVDGIMVDKVVDTTAAGDTFVGYYAVRLARWASANGTGAIFEPEEALRHANKAAAKAVTKAGAIDSIPWGFEI